jgi:DNA-binding NarL/FixJ family response regulator
VKPSAPGSPTRADPRADPGASPPAEALEVWLVEDSAMLRGALGELIDRQPDMRCALAVGDCESFLTALDAGGAPDVVLIDIGLPGRSGIDGISRLHSQSPASKAIVLTIHAEDDKVFAAICAGASGYLLKPSPPERIVAAVREAARGAAPINAYIAGKMLAMFARLAPKPAATGEEDYGLTARERQILDQLVAGLTLRQIAEQLHLSHHTIGNHLRNVYRKLHVRSRSGAVAKALREELV